MNLFGGGGATLLQNKNWDRHGYFLKCKAWISKTDFLVGGDLALKNLDHHQISM